MHLFILDLSSGEVTTQSAIIISIFFFYFEAFPYTTCRFKYSKLLL